MKRFLFPLVAILVALAAIAEAQTPAPAPPPQVAPAGGSLMPKQQITGFYGLCKSGKSGEGIRELLSSNPALKPEDLDAVSKQFETMISAMGTFLDFEITKETSPTIRVAILSCIAHFQTQPFLQEFTFYDAGGGDWRLLHVRYDANIATMFSDSKAP